MVLFKSSLIKAFCISSKLLTIFLELKHVWLLLPRHKGTLLLTILFHDSHRGDSDRVWLNLKPNNTVELLLIPGKQQAINSDNCAVGN